MSNKTRLSTILTPIQYSTEVLTTIMRQRMEIKRIYIAKEDVKSLFEDDMIVELPVRQLVQEWNKSGVTKHIKLGVIPLCIRFLFLKGKNIFS